jgi:hypothetical protein
MDNNCGIMMIGLLQIMAATDGLGSHAPCGPEYQRETCKGYAWRDFRNLKQQQIPASVFEAEKWASRPPSN